MLKSFNALPRRGPQAWLLGIGTLLLLANIAALFFYIAPPGGSRASLIAEREQIHQQIVSTRATNNKLRTVSGNVETGAGQQNTFETHYFLPERTASEQVLSELQRLAQSSGVEAREAAFSKEPIEGSDDLSVLNIGARFEGTYGNLMHFLNQVDRSPMLLMLDTLQASPQEKGGVINTQIRFQVIVRDDNLGVQQ